MRSHWNLHGWGNSRRRHNPMTYDFYTQCTCGQDGSNILASVAELYKMQIDPMFLNILCSSFAEGCKNKAPTKKKIWSYLRVDKRGSHGDFCQMTGHDSWISEQSKHRNNRAAQVHQSRSNDCSVGIQRPCLLRDGDRIWNDFVSTPGMDQLRSGRKHEPNLQDVCSQT